MDDEDYAMEEDTIVTSTELNGDRVPDTINPRAITFPQSIEEHLVPATGNHAKPIRIAPNNEVTEWVVG